MDLHYSLHSAFLSIVHILWCWSTLWCHLSTFSKVYPVLATIIKHICEHNTKTNLKLLIKNTLYRNSEFFCGANAPGSRTAPLMCPNAIMSPSFRRVDPDTLWSLTYVPFKLVSQSSYNSLPSLQVLIIRACILDISPVVFFESRNRSATSLFLPIMVMSELILKKEKDCGCNKQGKLAKQAWQIRK